MKICPRLSTLLPAALLALLLLPAWAQTAPPAAKLALEQAQTLEPTTPKRPRRNAARPTRPIDAAPA
jgi:hypothetical protein